MTVAKPNAADGDTSPVTSGFVARRGSVRSIGRSTTSLRTYAKTWNAVPITTASATVLTVDTGPAAIPTSGRVIDEPSAENRTSAATARIASAAVSGLSRAVRSAVYRALDPSDQLE